MSFGNRALFETIRSVLGTNLATSYAIIGSALSNQARQLIFVNSSDLGVFISQNNSTMAFAGHLFMPPNSQIVLDVTSNEVDMNGLFFAKGDAFYVKSTAAATTGSVYLSVVYAYGDNN